MKKKIAILSVICLTLITTTIIIVFGVSDYTIRLGNDIIMMQYPSFTKNDRLYMPIRGLSEALGIPIYWNGDKNEVHMDIYNKEVPVSDKTEYKKEGIIPDEETALYVGRIILERYANRPMEYETEDKIYYLEATYFKEFNGWNVSQTFDFKDERGWNASGIYQPNVILNQNTGEVMSINTYSTNID